MKVSYIRCLVSCLVIAVFCTSCGALSTGESMVLPPKGWDDEDIWMVSTKIDTKRKGPLTCSVVKTW